MSYNLGDTLQEANFEINGIFYTHSYTFSTINSTSSNFSCLCYFAHAAGTYGLKVRVYGRDNTMALWWEDTSLVYVNH